VSYHFPGFLPPVPQGTYQRGSTIPLKFKLANAAGTPISDAAALALLAGDCKVKLTVDGVVQTGCATYDAASDKFQRNWKVPQSMSLGDHTLGIQVSAPDGSGVVNTNSILVTIR
jgi:hypothetical protein